VFVRRCLAGERDAFGELVARHGGAVHRVAWRVLRSADDAEDAAQEAFVRAWRALPAFDQSREFRPWMLRIAANAAITMRSARRDHEPLDETDAAGEPLRPGGLSAPGASPADVAQAREMLAMVHRAVGAMPADAAALFQLRYGEELTVEEISEVLGMRPNAVAVALHRLRGRIRRLVFGGGKGDAE
jgi:RNA polymerase sigma-70 factor (ECF subfamily)